MVVETVVQGNGVINKKLAVMSLCLDAELLLGKGMRWRAKSLVFCSVSILSLKSLGIGGQSNLTV